MLFRSRLLAETGPDVEAENRLAKALWELGELGGAREHYQKALALDPTNRIAERNIELLKILIRDAGEHTVPAKEGSKAPVSIFVEETGKTGFAHLTDLADYKTLAQVNLPFRDADMEWAHKSREVVRQLERERGTAAACIGFSAPGLRPSRASGMPARGVPRRRRRARAS